MARTAPFVGRDGELSRLLAALDGDARLVLIVGDAGIGKTRFTAEGMSRAAAAGMVVVRGECLPVSGALPLLPVVSALADLAGLDGGAVIAAALQSAPEFARTEVGRLLPEVAAGSEPSHGVRAEGWRQERLLAGVAELLSAVARRVGARVAVVVEDVHWADSATLDCLTFLSRAGRTDAVAVVVTCRADEAPLAKHVADWLAQMRGVAAAEEITLGPLSKVQVAGQVAALAGGPVSARAVDELFTRAQGNPFFTEQLVASALAGGGAGELQIPIALPGRLAGLLAARASRCGENAHAVLAALAVASRPLTEELLSDVTALELAALRQGLRELAAARLLADDTAGGAYRPRHALLAEAAAAGLLLGERAALHERLATALAGVGDRAISAEVAGHWQAVGRNAEELAARMEAAEVAEARFGYAEAATHWRRAIELGLAQPSAADIAGTGLPSLYGRAIDALLTCGDRVAAGELAEEACNRFAGHPDAATAANVYRLAAHARVIDSADAGLPLIEESLRLFGQAGPSAEHALAWLEYATMFLLHGTGQRQASLTALNRALETAEAADATALIPAILPWLAVHECLRGNVDDGLAMLDRALALARAAADSSAELFLAVAKSDTLLKMAKFASAADVAEHGLGIARQAGLGASGPASILAINQAEALLALGRTAEAAALIDPLTSAPPDRNRWACHEVRSSIDLLRGEMGAATRRREQLEECFGKDVSSLDNAREAGQRAADLALWAGRPADALAEVRRVLARFTDHGLTILCGRLLAAGMRACADLAEQSRARLDHQAASAALAAADGLVLWADQMSGTPFIDHPFVATIPAERASWEAERTRLGGASDPQIWGGAAKGWQDLGCRHRAGYSWWRQAQAQLDAGQPRTAAAVALRAAGAAADGHAPLMAQVCLLAERARIPLQAQAGTHRTPLPEQRTPYGLTGRELAVLRLLAAGRTNAQIGAELYISPKTASVHVTGILRKFGVSGRVQAAALAERAGLLRGPER